MENKLTLAVPDDAVPCYCWKCYVKSEFIQDFGSFAEYRCPQCTIRIRLGDAEGFDPLRNADDNSDSLSVCASQITSQRSTTHSESETGGNDVSCPLTPENFDFSDLQALTVPTNTPAEADVPDAPPNIAKAFEDVTKYLLSVPTPRRRTWRRSYGGLSNTGGSELSPSKMVRNVVQAYKKYSLSLNDVSERKKEKYAEENTKTRSAPSPDTDDDEDLVKK